MLQIGRRGQSTGSNDTHNVNKAADMHVYPKTNELFVADGYANRRVIVFDADTGAFKRYWGAYGEKPDDKAENLPTRDKYGAITRGAGQFNTVHGIKVSNDGMVYVADRRNNRIQVFTLDGKFVKEGFVSRNTTSVGTTFAIAFSVDPEQRFMYVPDASNGRVNILNRESLEVVGSFGRWGPYAGQFELVHSIAVDSKGNIYTGEVILQQRVQKFVRQ